MITANEIKLHFYIHNQSCCIEPEYYGFYTMIEIMQKIKQMKESDNFTGFIQERKSGQPENRSDSIILTFQDKY